MARFLAALAFAALSLRGDDGNMIRDLVFKYLGHRVNPSFVAEPTQGPWKRNFNWGGAFNEAMPLTAGAELPLFSNDDIPGPPRVQSIVLQRNPQSDSGDNADFRAKIEYGVGAVTDQFFCDWTRGAQFTLVANWIRVTAVTYAPSDTDPYDPLVAGTGLPAKVIIGAGVAEGTTYKTEPLTFTEPMIPVPNATTLTRFAPDFARAVIVNSPNATIPSPSNIEIQLGSGVAPLARWTYEELHSTYPRGALLPGGTRYINIVNNSGAIRSMSIVWVLGL